MEYIWNKTWILKMKLRKWNEKQMNERTNEWMRRYSISIIVILENLKSYIQHSIHIMSPNRSPFKSLMEFCNCCNVSCFFFHVCSQSCIVHFVKRFIFECIQYSYKWCKTKHRTISKQTTSIMCHLSFLHHWWTIIMIPFSISNVSHFTISM